MVSKAKKLLDTLNATNEASKFTSSEEADSHAGKILSMMKDARMSHWATETSSKAVSLLKNAIVAYDKYIDELNNAN